MYGNNLGPGCAEANFLWGARLNREKKYSEKFANF